MNAVNLSRLERRAWALMLTCQPDVLPLNKWSKPEKKKRVNDGWESQTSRRELEEQQARRFVINLYLAMLWERDICEGRTWLIRLSRGLPSEPTKQVSSCGIHANHWMGGTPMQYLSTASARVFLSSKLSSHNTCRWKMITTTKKCEEDIPKVPQQK